MYGVIFNTLQKRKHVIDYSKDDIPSKETVNDILWHAWKTTPSKQNMMPYQISVYGPEHEKAKDAAWSKVAGNHHAYEVYGTKKGRIKEPSYAINPYYSHIQNTPWLLIFQHRVCTYTSPFYEKQIERGHYMEQMYRDEVVGSRVVSFEAGLFASNVTAMCLEKDIDVSYCGCWPYLSSEWEDVPGVNENLIILMTLGKGSYYRRQRLEEQNQSHLDYKTAYEDIVKFI
jgi:hypothetical protein